MTERKKRNHYIEQGGPKMSAMYALLFLFFIKICFLTKKIGVAGVSYFAMAFAVFWLLFSLNGSLIPESLRKMVLFQVNRRSVRNAVRLYRVIWNYSMILTFVSGAALFLLSDQISLLLFRTLLVSLPIKLFGIVLICIVPQQCMKGYLEGISSQIPGIVSMFILMVIDLGTTILLQNPCMEYGNKVAALMRDQRYYYAYACLGGIVGMAVGSLFSLLFLIMITTLLKQMQKERMKADETKNSLKASDILRNYLANGAKELLPCCYLPVLFLCTCVMFSHADPENLDGIGMLFVSILAGIPVLLNAACQGKFAFRQIHMVVRKGDYSHARERIAVQLKTLLYQSIFVSVLLACTAASFNALCFDVTTEEMLAIFRGIQMGVLLLCLAVMIICIVSAYSSVLSTILIYPVGIAAFLVLAVLFRNAALKGALPFVYALLVSSLVLVLFGGFVLLRKSHYKDDLIRVFVLPGIAGVVLVLICLPADKLLYKSIGAPAAFLLALLAGYICYQLVIILTRTFDRHEWNELPLHNVPVFLAKKLHMY